MTRTMAVGAAAGEGHARSAEGAIDELNGCIRLIRCAATGRMVKQGVSMTHLHVMWRLEEYGEMPMSRLADFLGVSFSNATGLIDRMEERGLVERIRDTDDRRVVFVRLTAAGHTILEEVQVMKRDLLTDVLARLDERQTARLQLALRDFRAALRAEERVHPERFAADVDPATDQATHTPTPPAPRPGRELATR